MTSKMRQMFRNKVKKKTLWCQKVCQKYAITSKKFVITSKTCYDIRNTFSLYFVPKIMKQLCQDDKNLAKGLVMAKKSNIRHDVNSLSSSKKYATTSNRLS